MNQAKSGVVTLMTALLLGAGLAACEKEGPMERAGENIDQSVERAGEKIEDAGDEAKRKMQ